jgi:hypothetical protein
MENSKVFYERATQGIKHPRLVAIIAFVGLLLVWEVSHPATIAEYLLLFLVGIILVLMQRGLKIDEENLYHLSCETGFRWRAVPLKNIKSFYIWWRMGRGITFYIRCFDENKTKLFEMALPSLNGDQISQILKGKGIERLEKSL